MTKGKKLFLIFLSVFGIFLVAIIGNVIYQISVNGEYYQVIYSAKDDEEPQQRIDYETADFEENIYEDAEYMSMDREITFYYGTEASSYSTSDKIPLDADAKSYGAGVVFLQSYLNCIIDGDYERYRDYFWDSYFEDENNFPYPEEPFTMQKLYNIVVQYCLGSDEIVSDTESRSYYMVKYMIYGNNGTFRPDLPANTTINLLFELEERDGEIRISKIVKYVV